MNPYLINTLIAFGIGFVFLFIDMVFIQDISFSRIWFIVILVGWILVIILNLFKLFDGKP